MPSTSTLMIAARVSKRRSMSIDSSGTHGIRTVSAAWPSAGQFRATQTSDAAGTSARG